MDDNHQSIIRIYLPAISKGRWIRASREAHMKLGAWIESIVEHHMQEITQKISIPEGLDFADLRLARESDGSVSFDWDVIARICDASGLPIEDFRAADPVADDLIAESIAEESAGQTISYRPGSA